MVGRSRRVLACTVVLAAMVLPGRGAAAVSPSRVPPYDFGCLVSAEATGWNTGSPCAVDGEDARHGRLYSSIHPTLCVFYGPPFVFPCVDDVSSSTGIYARTKVPGRITLAARVRNTGEELLPAPLGTTACLSIMHSDGGLYHGYGCRRITTLKRSIVISTTFEKVRFPVDRYALIVSLHGGPGSVFVEKIKYKVSP